MPKKYYELVRSKRILNLLNVEDNVMKLRHTNAEEYIEVFGSNYQPVENHDCNRSQQSQYRAEAEQALTTKQFESQASNVCHQPPVSDGATSLLTRRRRRAHRRRIIMSDEDEDVENHDQHSQYRAESEQELATKQKLTSKQGESLVSNVRHIRRAVRSKSLSDLSQDCNRSLSLRKTQSTLLLTEGFPRIDVSSTLHNYGDNDRCCKEPEPRVIEEVVSKSDKFQTFSVCHIRREVRSWSLSDLTQDSVAFYDRPLKKSKSAPLITEEFSQHSPSLIAGYHSTALPEAERSPPNIGYGPVDSSTDSDVETTEEYGDLSEGRKRRHVPEPDSWKRNRAKVRRMQGESYLGFSKPRNGKFQQNTPRPAREIGERCQSDFCKKSKLRACTEVTESIRQNIHQSFWKDMSWEQRKVYVSSLVTRSDTTRKTKSTSRREGTYKYFLPIKKDGSLKVQVCRNMFLNTLSLGSFTVQAWVKKCEFGMTPNNNVEKALKPKPQRPETKRKVLTANNFLNWLPKMPSHYARKETSKLYIEPSYHSLVELYNAYKTYCNENEEPQVSRFTFEKIFHEKNLSLYTLKKDMCDVCSAYRAGNLDEADYQIHIIKKERARKEKNEDKIKAAAGQFILLCMDLEAVKVCPYLTASALYFKTKLSCHNFTIYNLITNHCTCYWFTETAADLKASTFATCIIDYIERRCISQNLPIVIYSDGCTYQNRNTILANALLNCSKVNNINIYQKYLEPGHTQMECDSVHSAIERKLKNREIHLPSDYITITKEARKNTPYETVDVGHDFVKDYTAPENIVYKNIRPGRKPGDPQVVDIKVIHYNTMTIDVKLSFDSDWIPLPQRPRVMTSAVAYHQLHQNSIPIAATKYKHLQELKTVLPKDCHAFYDSLPYI